MIQIDDSGFRPAPHLVVAFTGVSQGLGGIEFEFEKSLSAIDCRAVFVADTARRWYQYGPQTVAAVTAQLRELCRLSGAERITFLGNSMGGFGALYFGSVCGAHAILGFCPQTAIDPDVTDALGDSRWADYQRAIPVFPFGDLSVLAPAAGEVTLCVGADNALDRAHTDRLAEVWSVTQVVVPAAGHDAAAKLKERGELLPLIQRTMTGR